MKTFKTSETVTVNNYPYGRLQCQMTFGSEFKQGKGFRTTRQSVNPKTGRTNKIKCSTYSPFILMVQDEETNFVSFIHADWYQDKDKLRFLGLVNKYFDLLTAEQIEYFALYFIKMTKIDFIAAMQYTVSPKNQDAAIEILKTAYQEPIKILAKIAKTKENLFLDVAKCLDFDKINSIKEENYNPFTITTHKAINIMDM